MARLFTLLGTPAAVGGSLTVLGDGIVRASFAGLLATLAVAGFRAIVQSEV